MKEPLRRRAVGGAIQSPSSSRVLRGSSVIPLWCFPHSVGALSPLPPLPRSALEDDRARRAWAFRFGVEPRLRLGKNPALLGAWFQRRRAKPWSPNNRSIAPAKGLRPSRLRRLCWGHSHPFLIPGPVAPRICAFIVLSNREYYITYFSTVVKSNRILGRIFPNR